jgi:hypothetical protein
VHPALNRSIIAPTPSAVSCELAGEAVILDMNSGRYYALDPIGTRIWQLLETPCTAESLCARLLEDYDVDPARCYHDVSTLLNHLAGHGLVTFEDASLQDRKPEDAA